MRILRLPQWLALLFFVCAGAYLVHLNTSRPRILVVQSYFNDYSWTRDIDAGIRRALNNPTAYTVRWHYLDLKRHTDEPFRKRAANSAIKVIEDWKPDVILAVNDAAQQYVAKNYVNHPTIKIVYAAINGEPSKYGYDKANNVTGIVERKALVALRETMIEVAKAKGIAADKVRFINIGDRSDSILANERYILEQDWAPIKLVDSKLVASFDEWKKVVIDAEKTADFIIFANYRNLLKTPGKAKNFVSAKTVMEWTEKNSVAIPLGMQGFNVEDGAPISVGPSPLEQGEISGDMAEAIILGKAPKDIPTESTRQYVVYMSESKLKARKLTIPAIHEAFARAANTYFP